MIKTQSTPPVKIIGLDPGSLHFGYSVLISGHGQVRLSEYGVIKPDKKLELSERLFRIFQDLDAIFSRNSPDLISIEEIFYHKNIRSAIVLAQARSIGLILASKYGAALKEFSARKVKLSVTGIGSAEKEAVQRMVCSILGLKEGMPLDASDAIAIGLSAHFERQGIQSPKVESRKMPPSGKWTLDSIREMGLKIKG